MKTKQIIRALGIGLMVAGLMSNAWGQQTEIPHQTEAEFQKLMPITGPVETMGGTFQLDHSFPTSAFRNQRASPRLPHSKITRNGGCAGQAFGAEYLDGRQR